MRHKRLSRWLQIGALLFGLLLLIIFVLLYQGHKSQPGQTIPGSELRALTPKKRAAPGEFVTLVFALHNDKQQEQNYALSLAPPTGWITVNSLPEQLVLPADETKKLFITLRIPRGTPAGNYTATLTAHNSEQLSCTVQVRVAKLAVPQVLPESPRAEAEAGSEVELVYKVRNVGNIADAFAIAVEAPPGWKHQVSAVAASVEPGGCAHVVVQLQIPVDASVKVYRVGLKASTGKREAEGVVKLTVMPGLSEQ